MTGTLYHHAAMHNVYVYEDADGALWQLPMIPNGWAQKRPYLSDRASLRDIAPNTARVLASTAGIPEGTE